VTSGTRYWGRTAFFYGGSAGRRAANPAQIPPGRSALSLAILRQQPVAAGRRNSAQPHRISPHRHFEQPVRSQTLVSPDCFRKRLSPYVPRPGNRPRNRPRNRHAIVCHRRRRKPAALFHPFRALGPFAPGSRGSACLQHTPPLATLCRPCSPGNTGRTTWVNLLITGHWPRGMTPGRK